MNTALEDVGHKHLKKKIDHDAIFDNYISIHFNCKLIIKWM